jgi:monoamine oxidase
LKEYGALDDKLAYRGSMRTGWRETPGGGDDSGKAFDPLDINQLFNAGFWSKLCEFGESPVQVPTMMRPIGGMMKISEAIARTLGNKIWYGVEVTRLRRKTGGGSRIEWKNLKTGEHSAIDADYVFVTIQPGLLVDLDTDFTPNVKQALAAPQSSPLAKVAFQADRRFWEIDEQIYGGISWTDHPITQIWYPSQGIHAKKGVIVGAYMFFDGEEFANKSLPERLEWALQGGELLHPGAYRKHVSQGVSVAWRKMKWSSGATTHWSDEARAKAYPVLLEPDGPYYFAGEYMSYVNGWQEGAVRSAHFTIERLAKDRANNRDKVKGS